MSASTSSNLDIASSSNAQAFTSAIQGSSSATSHHDCSDKMIEEGEQEEWDDSEMQEYGELPEKES
ncbi:hypothetical protein BT96DRAFT_992154 [Gymnopus androsaceus JB14]|uniref:Uncharacterized protein n=1 Tax=Gymnopus androsaceus JB14 TaxID=1447944 RepID=A0A6A4HXZ3_9AGAR|nr:hypothetical protein BT96DRAFT_992154 [Gymnopus androsaceus JB14]